MQPAGHHAVDASLPGNITHLNTLGGSDYLVKPSNHNMLVAAMQQLCSDWLGLALVHKA